MKKLVFMYLFFVAACTVLTAHAEETDAEFLHLRFLTQITNENEFKALSSPGGSFSGAGRSIKFLIDNRDPLHPQVNFINGNYIEHGVIPESAKYHYYFAKKRYNIQDTPEYFNASTYDKSNKRFYAGSIQSYRLGEQQDLTYAIQFFPSDVISENTLIDAFKILKPTIHIKNKNLIFIATGNQQTFSTIEHESTNLGIKLFTIDQILGSTKYIGVNVGEAWGILRPFPTNPQLLEPTDIPVFNELPLDLAVVAGTISKAYQDVNSHVNLKARERHTPNMVLRDATENSILTTYANKPIHLVVTTDGFTIEATTPDKINQKINEKLNKPWLPLPIVDEKKLLSFDELCPTASRKCFNHSKAMGGKTTGLGFLAGSLGRTEDSASLSKQMGYNLSPTGFGVPVKYYRDFMNEPENKNLKEKVNYLIQMEKQNSLTPATRNKLTEEIQQLFYSAKLSAELVNQIRIRLKETMPTIGKFKFRSSATSEDISNFNGAGLYDSFTVDLNKKDNINNTCNVIAEADGVVTKLKLHPNSIQCGVKAVYASLWNSRAVVERTYARLDHESAGMGIAINPSYGEESANAVLVTKVGNTDAVFGYTISAQKGNNLVTNPQPNTLSEIDVIAFVDAHKSPQISTSRFAQPSKDAPTLTTTILSREQLLKMTEIAKKIEIDYCKLKPDYSPNRMCEYVWLETKKSLSLDMEVKIFSDNHFLFKQVREFHGI